MRVIQIPMSKIDVTWNVSVSDVFIFHVSGNVDMRRVRLESCWLVKMGKG